jgi:flagellar motor switch protein FliG
MTQKIMREIDFEMLGFALSDSSEEIKEHIFCNMSKRASMMLKEDMKYQGAFDKSDIESAKQCILEAYDHIRWEAEKDYSFTPV